MESMAALAPSSEEDGGWVRDAAKHRELFAIVRERSFRTGTFTLSSGDVSNVYFNMKQTMMSPRGAELSARIFLDLAKDLDIDYVSGLEMGAVPVIGSMAAISSVENCPLKTTFVRKRAKDHGTRDVIEGLGPQETLEGANVLVIDDVSTSGRSILQAVEEIRKSGGIVKYAACIVNRAEGGDELLAANGVELRYALHVNEFFN